MKKPDRISYIFSPLVRPAEKFSPGILPVCLTLLLLLATTAHAQYILVPGTKVVKTAYINPHKLRRQYQALTGRLTRAREDWADAKKVMDQEWQAQEDTIKQQMHLDSLSGGKNREQIKQAAHQKRTALKGRYEPRFRKLHHDRQAALQLLEQRIWEATWETAQQGGFTQLKSLEKDSPIEQGADITDQILKQLN